MEDSKDPDRPGTPDKAGPAAAVSEASAEPSASIQWLFGRIDAEDEGSHAIIDTVSDDGLRDDAHDRRKMLDAADDNDYYCPRGKRDTGQNSALAATGCHLLALPSELVDNILSYLSPFDLAAIAQACRPLRNYAYADHHWQKRVEANVPGLTMTSPYPYHTFRELFVSHDPRWFLPKYKIWFCDRDLVGKLIVVRYDQRRGVIEGYQMLAVRRHVTFQQWPADEDVIIHAFDPLVKLHLDKPVLQLRPQDGVSPGRNAGLVTLATDAPSRQRGPVQTARRGNRFAAEVPMYLDDSPDRPDTMFSNFMLAAPLSSEEATQRSSQPFPYGSVWPPPQIPARHRVGASDQFGSTHALPRMRLHAEEGFLGSDESAHTQEADRQQEQPRPLRRSECSDQTFRIRSWMEMGRPFGTTRNIQSQMALITPLNGVADEGEDEEVQDAGGVDNRVRLHIGEDITTYSTLDPKLWTPTPDKPWRGIWVGDYSGHGCEFLLINQPDDEGGLDESSLVQQEHETRQDFERRMQDARQHRGRLEAIKLTGDANVPRGEYTFVADDLGEQGFVGVAAEPPFTGTRMVRSKGHVALTGFTEDKYIESQLLLISHDRLAQYWVGFGHISFFERVNVDRFIKP